MSCTLGSKDTKLCSLRVEHTIHERETVGSEPCIYLCTTCRYTKSGNWLNEETLCCYWIFSNAQCDCVLGGLMEIVPWQVCIQVFCLRARAR